MLASGTRQAHLAATACCVTLFALAFVLVSLGTRNGVGLSTDSSVYVGTARSLSAGHGARIQGEPLTHFPPLYPVTLALVGRITGRPVDAARWLQAALFATNVSLVAACGYAMTGGRIAAGLLAGLLVLACRSTLRVHLMAWSEPLFLLLALGAFALLALHLRRPRAGFALAAATALAAALLTRYAGLALLPPAALAVLVWGHGSARRRALEACGLVGLALAPLALWLGRNIVLTGSAANRRLAFHPLQWPQLEEGLRTLSFWVWPFQMGSLLGVAVLAGILAWALRTSLSRREPAHLENLVWLFLVSYPAFLVLSISFVDAGTPLQERVLSPLYPFGVLLLVSLLWRDLGARRSQGLWLAAAALGLAILCSHALRARDLWLVAYDLGLGYANRRWSESELLNEVRALPATTLLYSNAPDLIGVLLRRETRWLPQHLDTTSRAPNPHLASELARMQANLEDGALVAWFEAFAWRQQLLELTELERATGLVRNRSLDDGLILGLPGSPAAP